jgi:hypothetical protein
MTAAAAAAALILERWEAGRRFYPFPIDPVRGAEWPPGWHPTPLDRPYLASPAQIAALAITRANANALQHKAGPLSKRRTPFNAG